MMYIMMKLKVVTSLPSPSLMTLITIRLYKVRYFNSKWRRLNEIFLDRSSNSIDFTSNFSAAMLKLPIMNLEPLPNPML